MAPDVLAFYPIAYLQCHGKRVQYMPKESCLHIPLNSCNSWDWELMLSAPSIDFPGDSEAVLLIYSFFILVSWFRIFKLDPILSGNQWILMAPLSLIWSIVLLFWTATIALQIPERKMVILTEPASKSVNRALVSFGKHKPAFPDLWMTNIHMIHHCLAILVQYIIANSSD